MEKIIIFDIEIELTKKNIKNIYISVHPPNGAVKISAPKKMDMDYIELFVKSRLSWIRKQQEKFVNEKRQPEYEYVSGERHYFFGDSYILNIVYTNKRTQGIEIRNNGYMDLYVRDNTPKNIRERVLTEWYRNKLKETISSLIAKWEPIMGVKVNEFGVKRMKTRWGTCNPTARRIWINLELVKRKPIFLEYVVVHEMVHLLERSHSKRFISYMDKFMPNWRSVKAELNGLKN
jgi:predicted metal-dependent hydrolase